MTLLADIGGLFNRLIVAVVSLVTIIGATELLVAPDRTFAAAIQTLTVLQAASAYAIAGWAIVVGIIAVVVLLAEMLPWRLPLAYRASVNGGTVEYPASLVAGVIKRDLARVEGVRESRVRVHGSPAKVDVEVHVSVLEGDDCHAISTRTVDAIRDKVTGLGLDLGQVLLKIRAVEDRTSPAEQQALVAKKA